MIYTHFSRTHFSYLFHHLIVKHLPPEAIEGDVIRQDGDRFVIDKMQTEDRRKRLTDRLDGLFG